MRIILIFIFIAASQSLFASERAGRIHLNEVLLWPEYYSQETNGGEFQFYRTQFGLNWELGNSLRTQILVGSEKQKPIPVYYQTEDASENLAVLEAYGEYTGVYGRVRMGLMPLPITYENRLADRDLIFHDTLVFEKRILAKRDYGFSFYTENNGYFTEIMAHNGEIDQDDNDGNIWATARWGWEDRKRWHIEYAMQVGRTKPESTADAGTAIANFNINQSAVWKFTQLSIHWYDRKWDVVLEGLYGDIEQSSNDYKNRLSSYHADVIHMVKPHWGFGLRYDRIDLNEKLENDAEQASSLSLIFGGENDTSRFFITATKREEEGTEVLNDELRISWRLRPYF